MLETYLKVKTGQDVVNLGIVPKDSSSHVSLITKLRLEALRDKVLAGISEETLGKWEPLVTREQAVAERVVAKEDIVKYAKEGVSVLGMGTFNNVNFKGLEGVIRSVYNSGWQGVQYGVEWNEQIQGGNNLNGQCTQGYGMFVPAEAVALQKVVLEEKYPLHTDAVADAQLGHRVRFKKNYKGQMMDGRTRIDYEVPEGMTGILTAYDPQKQVLAVKVRKSNTPGKDVFALQLSSAYEVLEVSSLGQIEPLDKEEEVQKQVYLDFFPSTVLEGKRTERIIKGLLMGKDMIFYGPPGGGKSQTAKDIITLAKLQGVIFEVDNPECKANCNPFSIFDPEFAQVVPPCSDCMQMYDAEFKKTGRFNRPSPKDVAVIAARYGSGQGIVFVEGTSSVNRMHLAGFSIPRMEQGLYGLLAQTIAAQSSNSWDRKSKDAGKASAPSLEKKDADFHPGILIRSNNGVLHLDEMDKLRETALDEFLEALNSGRVQPEGLTYPYPSHQLIIGTANSNSKFSDALNDRMLLVAIRYSDDRDVSFSIVRKGYHKEGTAVTEVTIPDTHKLQWSGLRDIPMSVTLERAVNGLYIKFRNEYNGAGKNEVLGSNRSNFDALDAARAQLVLDQIFHADTGSIVTQAQAISGIQYAVCSRVKESSREAGQKAKTEINEWIAIHFPKILEEEESTWWCRAYKDVAIRRVQIPKVAKNFVDEVASYESDTSGRAQWNAHQAVLKAEKFPRIDDVQLAKVKYPFMNYLFKEQPGMSALNQRQLQELVSVLLEGRKKSPCKMDSA